MGGVVWRSCNAVREVIVPLSGRVAERILEIEGRIRKRLPEILEK